MDSIENQRCLPCEGFGQALTQQAAEKFMQNISKEWQLAADNQSIQRPFQFKNYYQTMAFVNAIAWMANTENHHPDLEVSYNRCLVKYTTHALKGLSPNDFICAAKVDALFQPFSEKLR